MGESATILIIDDDAGMRLTLSRILASEGYRVVSADNGLSGIAAAQDQLVDFALVDYRMTGLNGGQVCASLSQIRPEMVVYMTTAHVTDEAAESAVANGASGILFKPINIPALLALIAEETSASCAQATAQGGVS
jgi:DNA-binding NtrC family response regulator